MRKSIELIYSSGSLRRIVSTVTHGSEVEDMTQEVALRLLSCAGLDRAIETNPGDSERITTNYAFRIARNTWVERWRKIQRRNECELSEPVDGYTGEDSDSIDLGVLSWTQREILLDSIGYHRERLSGRELARKYEIKEPAARKRVSEIKKVVRKAATAFSCV